MRAIQLNSPIDPSETINDFFTEKNVFITGATGFMGKVLVEKLLRSCPDIGNIYILMRSKAGQSMEKRIQDLTNDELFDTLKKENSKAIKKIVPISGDIKELKLGMSDDDRKTIIEKVTIIYHVAASIKFNEPISNAILINVRATREACDLALNLKEIDAFMHVSTAYCHLDKPVIEEKLYQIKDNWRKMIEIAENCDPIEVKTLSTMLIADGVFPNTYTYSKSLAEATVVDLCEGKIPTIICRPTLVTMTKEEPFPGWQTTLNGPPAIAIAMGKGLLRTIYASPDSIFNYIPVDHAIKAMIKATWLQKYLKKEKISVYNCTNLQTTALDIADSRYNVLKSKRPLPLWYPNLNITGNKVIFTIKTFLYHLLPAIIIDSLLKCFNKTPRLMDIHRKIFIVMILLQHFMFNQWTFENYNFEELEEHLHQEDIKKFGVNLDSYDVSKYFRDGMEFYLLKFFNEKLNKKRNDRIYLCMKYIHLTLKYVFYIFLLRFLYHNLVIPGRNCVLNYWTSL